MLIDGGSCENVVSQEKMGKLELPTTSLQIELVMTLMKVLGAFDNPKSITSHSNNS